MPKFEVYDENAQGRSSRKLSKTQGHKLTTKKIDEKKASACVSNVPTKPEAKAPVEVRKSQRNEERRVLGCINNVKDANKKVVFPQKKRNKNKSDAPAAAAAAAAAAVEINSEMEEAEVEEPTTLQSEELSCEKYSFQAVQHLKELEQCHGIRGDYMKKQTQLTHDLRSLLVDWLVEVSENLQCPPEVIFVTCHYIDRFLSIMSVNNSRLQLLGITCLYLAWKLEDAPGAPYLSDLVTYIGAVCTDKEIIKMEKLVVRTLDFSLLPYSSLTFFNIFLHHQPLSQKHAHSAKYLLESSLLDGQRCLKYLPSTTAAACLCIARKEANLPPWTDLLTQLSGYTQGELDKCVRELGRFKRCLPIEAYSNIPLKYQKFEGLFKD